MSVSSRTNERIDATLAVKLRGGATGVTRNISPAGIYFETSADMKDGNVIRFTLEFDDQAGKLTLECTGEIVRVERADGKIGVAAKIIESRLQRRVAVPRQGAHT